MWAKVPDGVIMDALEDDLRHWHAAQAEADVVALRRIMPRIAQRRAEVAELDNGDQYLSAVAKLQVVPQSDIEPVVAPSGVGWVNETHWQRWWPTYLGSAAAVAAGVLAVWVVMELVAALAAFLAAAAPVLVGVPLLIAVVVLLGLLRGGRRFSGTFQGRMH